MAGVRTASLLAAAPAVVVSLPSLHGPLVWDDLPAIVRNRDVALPAGALPPPAWRVWRDDFWGNAMDAPESHKSYRLLTVLSFRANVQLYGLEHAAGFHGARARLRERACASEREQRAWSSALRPLTRQRPCCKHTHAYTNSAAVNVALHAAASGLVAWSAVALHTGARARRAAALVAGVSFAVHPLHAKAVGNVVGRAELLAAGAGLGAVAAYCFVDGTRALVLARTGARACALVAEASLVLCAVALVAAAELCKEQGAAAVGSRSWRTWRSLARVRARAQRGGLGGGCCCVGQSACSSRVRR